MIAADARSRARATISSGLGFRSLGFRVITGSRGPCLPKVPAIGVHRRAKSRHVQIYRLLDVCFNVEGAS